MSVLKRNNKLYSLYWIFWIIYVSHIPHINTTNIICSQQDDCIVRCSQTNNCNHKSIRCPTDNLHRCDIICENPQSCKYTTIFANNSTELNINCNTAHSCSGMNVHCPNVYPSSQQKQHNNLCIINTNQNTNSNVTIYAKHGWKTIRILNYTQQNTTFSGHLYCNSNQQSDICQFNLIHSLQCTNTYHQCNNFITTTQMLFQSTSHLPTTPPKTINESISIWDELKSIHYLWWIILGLMISIVCLICIILIYMRIQNTITKKLAEAHRISQTISHSQSQNINMQSDTIIKFSQEKSSKSEIKLQASPNRSTPAIQRQFSVPVTNNYKNNTVQLTRSKSYSNHINSDHSRAKTLTFKPRKEDLPSMSNGINRSNTTTITNITSNSNQSSVNSPKYNIDSTNESETLSNVSGSSKGSVHNNIPNQNAPINRFYPQKSDNSNQSAPVTLYSHMNRFNLQRNKSQYATHNYNCNQNYRMNQLNLQRYKSAPMRQQQQMQMQMQQQQQQQIQMQQQMQQQNNNKYLMQKRPLSPILSQKQKSMSPQPTIFNNEHKQEEKMEMNNNNLRLQHALENLAEEKKNNNHLSADNKHEIGNSLWTENSMIDAKSVLCLDNEPSGGLLGMLPGMFGNNDNDNDSNANSNGSDNDSIDSTDDDEIDRSY